MDRRNFIKTLMASGVLGSSPLAAQAASELFTPGAALPTMIVGFARYARADAFTVLRQEQPLVRWMVAGSILGAALGGMLLGLVPTGCSWSGLPSHGGWRVPKHGGRGQSVQSWPCRLCCRRRCWVSICC